MRLKINCDVCDARKINENNYTMYEEITINTDEMLVDDRSKEILNRLPFNIQADEFISEDENGESSKTNTQCINGIIEIDKNKIVEEGATLSVNGMLRIHPGTEEILKKYKNITVNGIILCPRSISVILPLKGLSLNGMTKVYPDDYVLLSNKYKLDKYFPLRTEEGKGYYAATYICDMDNETDYDKLIEKRNKFCTEKVYIRKGHLEKALQLFNVEAQIKEIPDDHKIVEADGSVLDEQMINTYGDKLYVIGDIRIDKSSESALGRITKLHVDGKVIIDHKLVDDFNRIGATCEQLDVKKGLVLRDCAIMNVDYDLVANNDEGVIIEDCALVNLDKNIPPEIILERFTIRDCAKVNCTQEQRSAVTAVSTDVAFIGTNSFAEFFNNFFGVTPPNQGQGNTRESDVKYVNADHYEL